MRAARGGTRRTRRSGCSSGGTGCSSSGGLCWSGSRTWRRSTSTGAIRRCARRRGTRGASAGSACPWRRTRGPGSSVRGAPVARSWRCAFRRRGWSGRPSGRCSSRSSRRRCFSTRTRASRLRCGGVKGVDVNAVIAAIDTPAVEEAYQRDRAEARRAAGSPTQLQGKHASTDGPVRYTAPSLVFEHAGRRLEAGGWQTIEAYDVIVANLIPDGERREVPDDPRELLTAFPDGLVTQEVAQLLTRGNDAPDRVEAEVAMLRLVADGAATRIPLGDDALW